MYYVYCRERSGDGKACWWKPNYIGYTYDLTEAGHYSESEAKAIEVKSRGDDFGVPVDVMSDVLPTRLIVETSDVEDWKKNGSGTSEGESPGGSG